MRAMGARSRAVDERPLQTWLTERAAAMVWIHEASDPDALAAFIEVEGTLVAQAGARLQLLRQAEPPAPTPAPEGRWVGIREVARLTNRSVSWIHHAPRDAIPGRRQNGPGCRAEWWLPTVQAWLEGLASPRGETGGAC